MKNEKIVYTRLINYDKFDELQLLIVDLFKIAEQYYDNKSGLKMRLAIERFLMLHKNSEFREILNKKRTFEE